MGESARARTGLYFAGAIPIGRFLAGGMRHGGDEGKWKYKQQNR